MVLLSEQADLSAAYTMKDQDARGWYVYNTLRAHAEKNNLTIAQVKVLGRSKDEAHARGLKMLDRVGLMAHKDKYPGQLSGGQQQRVAIARALISEPKVILADEPTGALDSQTSLEVMEVLRSIHRQGVTVLIVTHERDIAALCERVIRLKDGEIESDGRPEEVMSLAAVTVKG